MRPVKRNLTKLRWAILAWGDIRWSLHCRSLSSPIVIDSTNSYDSDIGSLTMNHQKISQRNSDEVFFYIVFTRGSLKRNKMNSMVKLNFPRNGGFVAHNLSICCGVGGSLIKDLYSRSGFLPTSGKHFSEFRAVKSLMFKSLLSIQKSHIYKFVSDETNLSLMVKW